MLCYNCKMKNICKVYDTIKETNIKIDITTCENYFEVGSFVLPTPSVHKTATNPNDKIALLNNQPRHSRALQDISELSNKMRKQNEPKLINGLKEVEEIDPKECPSCGDETVIDLKCSVCGKEICNTCRAIDLNDLSKIICEDCLNMEDEINE